MNRNQIRKACEKNKYLLLRLYSGYQMGINCKVIDFQIKKNHGNQETDYISYRPCGFMEYISNKHPFI